MRVESDLFEAGKKKIDSTDSDFESHKENFAGKLELFRGSRVKLETYIESLEESAISEDLRGTIANLKNKIESTTKEVRGKFTRQEGNFTNAFATFEEMGQLADEFVTQRGAFLADTQSKLRTSGLSGEETELLVGFIADKVKVLPKDTRTELVNEWSKKSEKTPGQFIRNFIENFGIIADIGKSLEQLAHEFVAGKGAFLADTQSKLNTVGLSGKKIDRLAKLMVAKFREMPPDEAMELAKAWRKKSEVGPIVFTHHSHKWPARFHFFSGEKDCMVRIAQRR